MAKKQESNEEKPATAEVEVELNAEAALSLALCSERVTSARAHLELRDTQLRATLQAISTEYQENGKYKVTKIDAENRKVTRIPA